MNTVKVRAIALGFDGFQRRKPGEEFYIREDRVFINGKFKSGWLELVDDKRVPAKPREVAAKNQRRPETGALKASDPKAHVPPEAGAADAGSDGGGSGNADVI